MRLITTDEKVQHQIVNLIEFSVWYNFNYPF